MLREEAIEILKQRECCRECVVDNGDCNDCDKAFDMAIKSLEQEPCDCIDRANAMTEIMMFVDNKKINDGIYIKVSDAVELMRKLPSVTPASKTGHWIKNERTFWTCDKCGFVNHFTRKKCNYCPDCGCRMESEE